jgi:hypothetical protein
VFLDEFALSRIGGDGGEVDDEASGEVYREVG